MYIKYNNTSKVIAVIYYLESSSDMSNNSYSDLSFLLSFKTLSSSFSLSYKCKSPL